MNTDEAISFLSATPFGTVWSWVALIAAIMVSAATCIIKLYKAFSFYKEKADKYEEEQKIVENHTETLAKIAEQLNRIEERQDRQREREFKKLRHTIVFDGERAVADGYITMRQLESLEEMYDDYHIDEKNGYVLTLMNKVRALEVRGTLKD